MGQRHSRLQPGDLIEIDQGHHQHWALYLGDGYVINVRPRETWGLRNHNSRVYVRDVQKQLLKEVVKKYEWRVNNDSDRDHTPLPAEEIIRRAEWWINREVLYGVLGRKCERFVKKLRYGDQPKTRERGEMHNADMAHDTSYPNPGDLIEIKRQGYQHWALYVGDGYVIHLTAADEKALALSTSTVTTLTGKVKVKKELLKEVTGNDNWDVNNKHDWYRPPFPLEDIIERAESWIDKEVPYDELGSNCEHFVTTLRYGEGVSDQRRAFVSGEMHIPDLVRETSRPNPGDLIEIKRQGYYQCVLYVWDGYVIHVTAADGKALDLSTSTETILTGKVKKELLKEVAGDDDWYVSNISDRYRTPLPVEEIIHRAESWIDKEVPYDDLGSNCERFMTKLRYGEEGSDQKTFACVQEYIPDMKLGKRYPNPGDMIKIKMLLFHHWALYVGGGYVVHVTSPDEKATLLRASTVTTLTRKAKVKKELLKEVARRYGWDVNNKYDWCRVPLPVEEIVRHAESWIGKEVPYDMLLSNCRHFVTMLRYGQGLCFQPKTLENGEMHNADMAHDTSNPNPGDLIEIKRRGYQHWALYVGDGYVIHVTAADEKALAVSTSTVTLVTRRATVKKELLKDVAKEDKWYVSNKHDWYRVPYPAEEIIERAESWIGKDVSYRLLLRNCEHFVTTLRYGEGVSDQAGKALHIFHGVAIAAGMGFLCVPSLGSNFFVAAPFMAAFNVLAKYSIQCFTLNQVRIDPKGKAEQKEVLDLLCC